MSVERPIPSVEQLESGVDVGAVVWVRIYFYSGFTPVRLQA